MKEIDKKIENLEEKELDEVLCAFIVEVCKLSVPEKIKLNQRTC